MTPEQRFLDSLLDMQEAASEAISFISGSTLEAFERDILTQRAVAMTFVLIAAAASRILSRFSGRGVRTPGHCLVEDQGVAERGRPRI
jgi:uncharacterized protein with HEPN domain